MKRYGYLMEKICDPDNFRTAWYKAKKGKGRRPEVVRFSLDVDNNLNKLSEDIRTGRWRPGGFHTFTISDPKKRTISAAPFTDRILHHAIMNILDPILDAPLLDTVYACRKGKGTSAAVKKAFYYTGSNDGVTFLGYLVEKKGIYLSAKAKKRFKTNYSKIERMRLRGDMNEDEASRRVLSLASMTLIARARNFRNNVYRRPLLGRESRQTWRQLEQQRLEHANCESEQQQPDEQQQQHRLPARPPCSPLSRTDVRASEPEGALFGPTYRCIKIGSEYMSARLRMVGPSLRRFEKRSRVFLLEDV